MQVLIGRVGEATSGASRLAGPRRQGPSCGFTLIEALIGMVLILIACLTLLRGIELTILQYDRSAARWEMILERWNQTQTLRSLPPQDGEMIQIVPRARPLYRDLVGSAGEGHPNPWEILRAER